MDAIKKNKVLCSISTRGRYETTLPLAILSIVMQTKLPDKLVIFDDNDPPKDVRELQIYQYIFQMLEIKGVPFEWLFAEKKGQHFNHQKANLMGYEFVWRMDDDTYAEPNVLENLFKATKYSGTGKPIGAVGGSILTPPIPSRFVSTGKIEDIDKENNIQWGPIDKVRSIDHLHCSFLYRAGIHDYNLSLTRIAHREETLFTYGLKQKGYQIIVVPDTITWHLKNQVGGIRDSAKQEMFEHDEAIFRAIMSGASDFKDNTIIVLDNGMGDHLVFKHVLPEIKNSVIFSCFPDIVPGRSIAEAKMLLGDISPYNIYQWMDKHNWKTSLESAFRELYVKGNK